jgi:two-component SAPR family response regulator
VQQIYRKQILVIDDEQYVIGLIRFCLRMYDYDACTFTSTSTALEHFKSNPKNHCMVISDISMSRINGYEFVKQIKRINSKVKVVLMTSFGMSKNEFSNPLPDVTIDAFITKPFTPNTLRNTLHLCKLASLN